MRKLSLLILLSLLMSWTSLAQSEQQLNYEQYTLDNGLEVILVQDASAPTVAVDIWYQVGGANDPEGKSGFAHLFEHLMFEGSANLPEGGMDDLITTAGGFNNAYTTIDYTGYYQALPSHQLPLALWIEADRMAGLPVTQINLDNQRAIVIEELQLRVTNSPYGESFQTLQTLPYTYEPYKRRVIGNIDNINAAVVEDVKDFHRTYYVPNNATLVVAGDIDFDVARGLIDDLFAPIPIGDEPPQLPEYELIQQDEAEIITMDDPLINIPAALIAYQIPPRESEDFPALDLLDSILSAGDSSRLAQSLLDTGQALNAYSLILDNRGPSMFGAVLLPNMGVEMEDIEQVFYDELQLILNEGVPQDELDKTIAQIRTDKILELETALDLAESVQAANYYFGDPQAVYTEIERYQAVTSEDIQRVIAEYLEETDRHVIYVNLSDAEPPAPVEPFVAEDAIDEDPDYRYVIEQSEPLPPLDVNEFTLPVITETVLDNGLEVVVIEQPNMPIISLDLIIQGGSRAVPADLSGLSDITGALISRGTTERDAQDLALSIEQVGGVLGSYGSRDSTTIYTFALVEDADLSFDLLSDMVLNATFPESEVERELQTSISGLEANLADPGFLAGRTFNDVLYPDHPYGAMTTFESLEAITRNDIVAFYEAQSTPDNAVLIIAGAITTDEGVALAEEYLGEWEGESELIEFPEIVTSDALQIYLVNRPGSSQAEFIIGNIGVEGDSLEFFPIRVMNEVFGGNFASRLVQNIREDKGYTYSIGSGFSFPADVGTFQVTAAVRNDVIDLAIQEVFAEIERVQTEPFTDDELANSKAGIIGRFALALETYQQFVDAVASYKIRGVDLGRLSEYPGLVDAVTTQDVLDVANNYIQPDNFVVVVVGDAAEIQEQLESIGSVTVIESE